MTDFILANWQTIIGILFSGGILAMPKTRVVLKKVIVAGINALLTEDMIISLILKVLDRYVKSTKTDLDDEWLENLKKELAK